MSAGLVPDKHHPARDIIDRLDMCGCGSGAVFQVIRYILERAETAGSYWAEIPRAKFKSAHENAPPGFYAPAEDASPRWVEFAAHVADRFGLLEHGPGIGSASITGDGRTLLQWFRDYGTEIDKWPEESCR